MRHEFEFDRKKINSNFTENSEDESNTLPNFIQWFI